MDSGSYLLNSLMGSPDSMKKGSESSGRTRTWNPLIHGVGAERLFAIVRFTIFPLLLISTLPAPMPPNGTPDATLIGQLNIGARLPNNRNKCFHFVVTRTRERSP